MQSDRIALALDDFFRDDLRGRVGPIGEPQRAQGVFIGGGEDLDLVRAKGTIFQEATDRHGQLPISLNSFEDGSPEAFPSSPSPTEADDAIKPAVQPRRYASPQGANAIPGKGAASKGAARGEECIGTQECAAAF